MSEDITDLAHERDGDGDLLPVEREVDVRREGTVTVEIYPGTSGQRKEWQQRLRDEPEELPDDVEAELLGEFAAYDPAEFGGAESWDDVRPAIVDALGDAILEELLDAPLGAFGEALDERAGEGN